MDTIGSLDAAIKADDHGRFEEQLAYTDFALTEAKEEAKLELGGVCVLLRTDSQELHGLIERNYGVFLSRRDPIAEVEIKCEEYEYLTAEPRIRHYSPHFPYYTYAVETMVQDSKAYIVSERAYVGLIDLVGGTARFNFFSLSMESLDSCLRIVLPYFFVKCQCHALLMHACSVATPVGGFVFPGRSGVGKTTIAKLATGRPDVVVLTDEIALLRRMEGTYKVFGTPFLGAEIWDPKRFVNTSAELKAILFPVQNTEVFATDVAPARALVRLLSTVVSFVDDLAVNEALMDLCIDLLERVPSRELHFSKSPDLWRRVR